MKAKTVKIDVFPPMNIRIDHIMLTKTKAFVMVDTGKAYFCVTMSKAAAKDLLRYRV